MAITKMWSVKSGVSAPLFYITQVSKTNPDAVAAVDQNTGEVYTYADIMALRDVIGFRGQQAQRQELGRVLGYAVQEGKTEERFVTGVNCAAESALLEMETVKQQWNKTGSIQCIHAVQSFRPGEISPELAHNIGVELAQKLWGKRFQVVVATHLDREHIHNHFCINSVSFADGLRFYNNYASYDLMRVTSDQICREYALSVIERPKKGRQVNPKAYDQAGIPRPEAMYVRVKRDVDEAIRHSRSMQDFFSYLSRQGYTFRSGNLKHFSLRPPGAARSCRIDKWAAEKYGLDYSLDGIARMISDRAHMPQETTAGNHPERPPVWNPEYFAKGLEDVSEDSSSVQTATPNSVSARYAPAVKRRFRGKFQQSGQKTPFRRLYLYYCYLFGVFPKRQQRGRYPRSEVYRMRDIAGQTRLLISNRIDTLEQLAVYRADRQARIDALCKERKPLYNQLRSAQPEERETIQAQIDALTSEIRKERREVKLCDEIRNRAIREAQYQTRVRKYRDPETAEQPDPKQMDKQSEKEEQDNAIRTGRGQYGNDPDRLVGD